MKTIERLRRLHRRAEECGRTGTTSDWVDIHIEVRNALPALLAVVEAAGRYVSDWDDQVADPKAACCECEDPEHIATIRAALLSLEGDA